MPKLRVWMRGLRRRNKRRVSKKRGLWRLGRLGRGAHLVAKAHKSVNHRPNGRLVARAAAPLADREAEVVARDHAEDAQNAGDVHRAAL